MSLIKLCRHVLLIVHSVHIVLSHKDHYVFVRQEMLTTRLESIIQ